MSEVYDQAAIYIVPTLRVGMHPVTLQRRVLVGITNKPEVIAVYNSRAERGNDVTICFYERFP
ncbi:hypothetical protein CCP3SC1_400019 [Gammaproteobacteria bacterium]